MDDGPPRQRTYYFDGFVLDLNRGALSGRHGAEVSLRPKAFTLMRLLVENAGQLLSRDAIMEAVWPDVIVTDDSITQCIGELRHALGDESRRLLRTIHRRGYLFAAAVSPAGSAEETQASGLPASVGERIEPALPPDVGIAQPSVAGSLSDGTTAEIGRRQLTVLCCGIVDPEGLLDGWDPEDAGAALSPVMARCRDVIAACGGHVATDTSQGLVAYFGYPHAREHAVERAVRAGLALVGTAEPLESNPGLVLKLCAGIATGIAVGQLPGDSTHGPPVVGRPLNLAAGLQALAAPGTVLIADTTRRLLGQLFAIEDLGACALGGFSQPVRVWQVIGEGDAESRFAALRGAGSAPLVGRERELALLLDCWRQAKQGEGQIVLLSGEPGIGKSRLIQALRDALASEPHAYVGYYCSSFHRDSPLRPVITQLERTANLARGDDPAAKLVKLRTAFARPAGDTGGSIALIASLLSIPNGTADEPVDISPQQRREWILAELVDQLARLAANGPVLLVWEDVHWADPSSLELLAIALDRLRDLPVLAVVSFRPEFAAPWSFYPHATWLGLSRLGRNPCGELILDLCGGRALPAELLEHVLRKADGVPLFVEEITRAILDSGWLRQDGGSFKLDRQLPSLEVPESLQDSLMARLDRHAPIKALAQICSVIGREFSVDLLAAVAPLEPDDLSEALRQLAAAGLIFRRGVGPEAVHVFKHTLIRDIAYDSLLKRNRRKLHAQIARILEERFPQVCEAEPDLLARHWSEAGDAAKAAAHYLRAGERALARSATAEAVALLTTGRDVLLGLPEGRERDATELEIEVARGAALSAAMGLAAPDVERAYARARELCSALGEERRLGSVLLGLWASHNARDELEAARGVAVELLELARRRRDASAEALGRRALGATLFGLGQFADAREHLQDLVSRQDLTAGRTPAFLPYDPFVSGRAWLALTLAVLGYPEQAIAQSNRALADAAKLRHHNTLCLVLSLRCSASQFLRDTQDVARHADALLAVAEEQGFAYWTGLGSLFRGWAHAWSGETTVGIAGMRRGLEICGTTGARAYVPYNLALLAEVCLRAGDLAEARSLLDGAFDRLRQTDARYCEAELLRIDAELRLAMMPADGGGAEDSFNRAIKIAHGQQARTAELCAAMRLANLLVDRGRQQEARDLLAPIYGWFTEGSSTSLINQAGQLADALR